MHALTDSIDVGFLWLFCCCCLSVMGILLFEVQEVIALQVKVISLISLSFANWNRLQQEDLYKICEYC